MKVLSSLVPGSAVGWNSNRSGEQWAGRGKGRPPFPLPTLPLGSLRSRVFSFFFLQCGACSQARFCWAWLTMKWMQLLVQITPFCDQMYTFLNLCDKLLKFLEVKLTKWLYYFARYTIDGNKAPSWKKANNGGKNRWDTAASSGA